MTAWTVVNLSSSTLLCSSSKPNSWSEKKGPTQKGKQTEDIKAWDWINIWKSSTQLLLTLSWRTRQVKSLLDASLQFWSNFNTCSIAFSASLYRWKKHTTNSAHVLGPTWNHRMQMIKAHLCSMLTRLSVRIMCPLRLYFYMFSETLRIRTNTAEPPVIFGSIVENSSSHKQTHDEREKL